MVLDGLDFTLSRKNGDNYILLENPLIAKTGLYLVFRKTLSPNVSQFGFNGSD